MDRDALDREVDVLDLLELLFEGLLAGEAAGLGDRGRQLGRQVVVADLGFRGFGGVVLALHSQRAECPLAKYAGRIYLATADGVQCAARRYR